MEAPLALPIARYRWSPSVVQAQSSGHARVPVICVFGALTDPRSPKAVTRTALLPLHSFARSAKRRAGAAMLSATDVMYEEAYAYEGMLRPRGRRMTASRPL